MSLVIPNVGEVVLLRKMLKDALVDNEDYSMKLYTAVSAALSQTTVAGHFTEATFNGYAAKTLLRATWGTAATVSNKASISYPEQSWLGGSGANETILGYYIVAATSGTLLWAEAFSESRTVIENVLLKVTPVFTLNSEN